MKLPTKKQQAQATKELELLQFMRYTVPTFGHYLFDGDKEYILEDNTWSGIFSSLAAFVPSDLLQELADELKAKFDINIDIDDYL
jgi:hypothetical protein